MLVLYPNLMHNSKKFDNKIIQKRSESTETILLSILHILKKKIRAFGQTQYVICSSFDIALSLH